MDLARECLQSQNMVDVPFNFLRRSLDIPEAQGLRVHTVLAEGWLVLGPHTQHVRQFTATCATPSPRDTTCAQTKGER